MGKTIHYSIEHPKDFKQLSKIYDSLGWNSLNLTPDDLEQMCRQSWYAVYAFDEHQLVGMGRVISDGVITGLICGVCVQLSYQSKGIGKEMLKRLIEHCEQNRVIPQLMCNEDLESYYEDCGFEKFSVGMTRKRNR